MLAKLMGHYEKNLRFFEEILVEIDSTINFNLPPIFDHYVDEERFECDIDCFLEIKEDSNKGASNSFEFLDRSSGYLVDFLTEIVDALDCGITRSMSFDGEVILGARKKKQGVGSYIVPCLEFRNLFFYCVPYPDFEMDSKGGKICDFFTPHFHYYMLLRLLISLDDGLNLCFWRNDEIGFNMYTLSNGMNWLCFRDVRCLGLPYLRFDRLSTLLVSPKLLMVVLPNFRLGNGLDRNQVISSCFKFYILILGNNVVVSQATDFLGVCHGNGMVISHFCCGIKAVLTDYKPRMTFIMQMDSNVSQRAAIACHLDACCHLDVEVYASWLFLLDNESCAKRRNTNDLNIFFVAEHMGLCNFLRSLAYCISPLFIWLIMMSIGEERHKQLWDKKAWKFRWIDELQLVVEDGGLKLQELLALFIFDPSELKLQELRPILF